MTSLPGDRDPRPLNTGLPPRDLAADAHGLRHEFGADAMLLLVEDHELEASGVPDLPKVIDGEGIELLRFPVPDFGVTDDRDGLRAVLDDALARVRAGQRVVVACRAGRGRTGTIVACLLRDAGLDAEAAIGLTRASRTGTIEREAQERFVKDWPVGMRSNEGRRASDRHGQG